MECIEQSLIGVLARRQNHSPESPLTLLSFRKGVKPLRNLLVGLRRRAPSYKQIPPFGRNDKDWKRFSSGRIKASHDCQNLRE